MRPVHRTVVLVPLAVVAFGPAARRIAAQAPVIRVGGRAQVQYVEPSGDSTTSWNPLFAASGFSIRRLRIQADVQFAERANLTIQPSFEMGALRMRDAFLRVALVAEGPVRLGLTMGQEKKPFSRYELTSSNNLVVLERGLSVRGFVVGYTPPAQINLLEGNGYIAHDLGASLDATVAAGRVTFKAGAYNGSGESTADVNRAKTFAARVVATLIRTDAGPVLRAGVAAMSRDRGVTSTAVASAFHPDSAHRSTAYGVDLEWGDFRPGPHVVADFATGENLDDPTYRFDTGRNLGAVRADAPDSAFTTFRSFQVIASWRLAVGTSDRALVAMVEPALRLDLTDADTDADDTGGLLVTPAINVHFTSTAILRAGVDFFRYHDAAGARRSLRAVRVSWQANF